MKPQRGSTVDTVRDFWQTHINNEYYTEAERASDSYFDEIEQRRYDTHYHLPELFASMDGAGRRLLEVGCGIGVDSIQLAGRGFAVTAVDLTENALVVARQFAAHRGASIDFRLGNAEGLDFPPYPGELGKRIWESVSKEAWAGWLKHQTMLVNENRLNLADARARKYLAVQMEKHFFGEGADAASGYVPPAE